MLIPSRAKYLIFACVGVLSACATRSTSYEPQADREGIRRVVRQNWNELEKCYEQAIDERPGAEGKVVMAWEIASDGRALSVAVKEAGPKIDMIGPCLVRVISEWRFPKPNSEELSVSVSYPLFFSENGRLGEN